ncbi:MAG: hypothetical protein GY789_27605 [Hyphomicrobiales bacterium]|nr:hypothetical protein [Hyphomicrobiales bacterium]MCP4999298.1 hypothetical protein [Hyphomicrobiales bacterium]
MMGIRILHTAAALIFLTIAAPVFGADESIPNLVGTWTGEKTVYFLKGERHSIDVLKITEQSGAHFRGTRSWEHVTEGEPLGHAGDEHSHVASEPILGMIGFDNRTIYIVEHDDQGQLHAQLVDSDTMEVVYVEPGENAAVFRVEMTRKR